MEDILMHVDLYRTILLNSCSSIPYAAGRPIPYSNSLQGIFYWTCL